MNQQIKVVINDITRMSAKIAELTLQVQQLNTEITNLNAELATKNAYITELQGQISTLNNQISALQEQVTSLTATVTAQAETISGLNAQISSLNAQIATLNNEISAINTAINNINGESVENPLSYLATTKSLILSALQAKGSTATSATTFREYATEISKLNPAGDLHTKLLLRFSTPDSYGDVSMFNVPVTFSTNFRRSSTIKKFGDYSAVISGSSYLTINRFEIPVWKYTIEFWIYMSELISSNGYCVGYQSNSLISTSSFYILMFGPYNDTTKIAYRINNSYEHKMDKSLFTVNEWHHVAYTRNDNYWYTFLDGVRIESRNSSNLSPAVWTGLDFYLGRDRIYNTTAYVDEFRISDICRYTENFTPPTEPFAS